MENNGSSNSNTSSSSTASVRSPSLTHSTSTPGNVVGAAATFFYTKSIVFLGRSTRILLQNENGPCPLLSLCNLLVLRNQLQLPLRTLTSAGASSPSDRRRAAEGRSDGDVSLTKPYACRPGALEYAADERLVVHSKELVELLADELVQCNSRYLSNPAMKEGVSMNVQEVIYKVLPRLDLGLDVNCRFSEPTAFEYTPELDVFDLLDVTLVHGWLVPNPESSLYSEYCLLSCSSHSVPPLGTPVGVLGTSSLGISSSPPEALLEEQTVYDALVYSVVGGLSYNQLVEKYVAYRELMCNREEAKSKMQQHADIAELSGVQGEKKEKEQDDVRYTTMDPEETLSLLVLHEAKKEKEDPAALSRASAASRVPQQAPASAPPVSLIDAPFPSQTNDNDDEPQLDLLGVTNAARPAQVSLHHVQEETRHSSGTARPEITAVQSNATEFSALCGRRASEVPSAANEGNGKSNENGVSAISLPGRAKANVSLEDTRFPDLLVSSSSSSPPPCLPSSVAEAPDAPPTSVFSYASPSAPSSQARQPTEREAKECEDPVSPKSVDSLPPVLADIHRSASPQKETEDGVAQNHFRNESTAADCDASNLASAAQRGSTTSPPSSFPLPPFCSTKDLSSLCSSAKQVGNASPVISADRHEARVTVGRRSLSWEFSVPRRRSCDRQSASSSYRRARLPSASFSDRGVGLGGKRSSSLCGAENTDSSVFSTQLCCTAPLGISRAVSEEKQQRVDVDSPRRADHESALLSEGPILQDFLETTSSQLTAWGLYQVTKLLKERELAVLFRNNHFSTVFKYNDCVFALATDIGFGDLPQIVWEKFDRLDGNTEYCNHRFEPSTGASSGTVETEADSHSRRGARNAKHSARGGVENTREQADFEFAMQLQKQEEEAEQRRASPQRQSSAYTASASSPSNRNNIAAARPLPRQSYKAQGPETLAPRPTIPASSAGAPARKPVLVTKGASNKQQKDKCVIQ